VTLAEYPDVGRVGDVARVLDCSTWSVYQLIESRRLKAVRIGRAIRVTRVALEKFLLTLC
jgi:excisionase family DNA binding protein